MQSDIAESPDQFTPTAWARPLCERQIAMLGELAEVGLDMALEVRRQGKVQALGSGEGSAATDPAPAFMAFARTARAVRLTVMLQARLVRDLEAWDREVAYRAARGVADEGLRRDEQVEARKGLVERLVGRVAADGGEAGDEVERLCEEAAERLDHDDIYGDVLARPVSELVAVVCRDLGLSPDWPRLAEEAWARDELATGEAGWPLVGLGRDRIEAGRRATPPPGAGGVAFRPDHAP